MTDTPLERYKEALQRGHMSALRGRLDAAAAAYREAAAIAPDRSLPYVGLGGVLVRLGRSEDSLRAYTAALDRSPNDEGALRGRADALTALGRRAEAADVLDQLAESLEREERPAEACDAACRALELAESRGRRRLVERLSAALRAMDPGDPVVVEALQRAANALGSVPTLLALDTAVDGPGPTPAGPPDPAALTLAVEEALEAGDLDEARRRALVAGQAHRRVGQFHAAMDACYQALTIMPADPDIHLLLAELYLDRGWRGPAADKLVLLGRLSKLTGDGATRGRLCYLAAAKFPDDPRLAAICA
jgi:tetratricopeptide (TPR) repeat protein